MPLPAAILVTYGATAAFGLASIGWMAARTPPAETSRPAAVAVRKTGLRFAVLPLAIGAVSGAIIQGLLGAADRRPVEWLQLGLGWMAGLGGQAVALTVGLVVLAEASGMSEERLPMLRRIAALQVFLLTSGALGVLAPSLSQSTWLPFLGAFATTLAVLGVAMGALVAALEAATETPPGTPEPNQTTLGSAAVTGFLRPAHTFLLVPITCHLTQRIAASGLSASAGARLVESSSLIQAIGLLAAASGLLAFRRSPHEGDLAPWTRSLGAATVVFVAGVVAVGRGLEADLPQIGFTFLVTGVAVAALVPREGHSGRFARTAFAPILFATVALLPLLIRGLPLSLEFVAWAVLAPALCFALPIAAVFQAAGDTARAGIHLGALARPEEPQVTGSRMSATSPILFVLFAVPLGLVLSQSSLPWASSLWGPCAAFVALTLATTRSWAEGALGRAKSALQSELEAIDGGSLPAGAGLRRPLERAHPLALSLSGVFVAVVLLPALIASGVRVFHPEALSAVVHGLRLGALFFGLFVSVSRDRHAPLYCLLALTAGGIAPSVEAPTPGL